MQIRRFVELRKIPHVLLHAVHRLHESCQKELAADCAGQNRPQEEQDVEETSQIPQVGKHVVALPLVDALNVACSQVNLDIFALAERFVLIDHLLVLVAILDLENRGSVLLMVKDVVNVVLEP